MYRIAEALSNLFADVLPYPDDIARRSHFHDLPVVGHTVESGVDQQTSFAEHRLDVERHLHVCGVHVFILQDYCIKFQYASSFGVHGCKGIKKTAAQAFAQVADFTSVFMVIFRNLIVLAGGVFPS